MESALKAQPSVKGLSRKDWGACGVELSICSRGGKKATLSFLTPQHTGLDKRSFVRAQLQAFPNTLKSLVLCECEAAATVRA